MRPNLTYALTFLAGVVVAIAARWLPYPAPTHAQAPSAAPGLFGAQSLAFTEFGDRPVQLFRLDEADEPYTVPEGKALIVTQLAGTVGQPTSNSARIDLLFDGVEVWRITADPGNIMLWYSNGIIIPGLQANVGTVVSMQSLGTSQQHGVILGYLVG